jgi:hypothetical protein
VGVLLMLPMRVAFPQTNGYLVVGTWANAWGGGRYRTRPWLIEMCDRVARCGCQVKSDQAPAPAPSIRASCIHPLARLHLARTTATRLRRLHASARDASVTIHHGRARRCAERATAPRNARRSDPPSRGAAADPPPSQRRYVLAAADPAPGVGGEARQPHLLQHPARSVAAGRAVGRGGVVLAAVACDGERGQDDCRGGGAGAADGDDGRRAAAGGQEADEQPRGCARRGDVHRRRGHQPRVHGSLPQGHAAGGASRRACLCDRGASRSFSAAWQRAHD